MALVSMKKLLESANLNNYGQPAFNVNSVAQIKAIIEAHEILRAPVILQGAELSNGFMGGKEDFINSNIEDKKLGIKRISDAVKKYAVNSSVPVVLHLDHGKDFESVKAAIDGGYTSVMIDGSSLPFEENIKLTRKVVDYAKKYGVSVEGELGVLAGVEDEVFANKSTYTNPLQAYEFVKKTGVDALAISYGTKHGAVKGNNIKLRHEIIVAVKEIFNHENINCSIVSHGSSTVPKYIVDQINELGGNVNGAGGIPIEQLQKAIRCGVAKINVDTDIRLAITRNLREYFENNKNKRNNENIGGIYRLLQENKDVVDPRVFLTPIMNTIMFGDIPNEDVLDIVKCIEDGSKEIVCNLISLFGATGKSKFVK